MANPANSGQMHYGSPYWGVASGSATQGDKAKQLNGSSIGDQIVLDVFIRKAIEEKMHETFFTQFSNSQNLPKNNGKVIKKHRYIPILDDRNVNGQGIDFEGNKGGKNKNGNLYGSSMDIGTIQNALPVLTEFGGRVNRVGLTRTTIESSVKELGFFLEFSQDSLSFDDDPQLLQHLSREAIHAAMQVNEQVLAIEILTQGQMVHSGTGLQAGWAGLKSYSGDSANIANVLHYEDLQNLAVTLKRNKAPQTLKACTGTRLVDTKTIPQSFVAVIPWTLEVTFRNFVDVHGNPVFIPVEKYAAGTSTLNGEIGTVGQFRIVVAPYLPEWKGIGVKVSTSGAASSANYASTKFADSANPYHTGESGAYRYDVAPVIAMSSEAYTALSFRTGSAKMPFEMKTRMPGLEAISSSDPYGKTGIHSISFFYGLLMDRPEWIIVQPTLIEKSR